MKAIKKCTGLFFSKGKKSNQVLGLKQFDFQSDPQIAQYIETNNNFWLSALEVCECQHLFLNVEKHKLWTPCKEHLSSFCEA